MSEAKDVTEVSASAEGAGIVPGWPILSEAHLEESEAINRAKISSHAEGVEGIILSSPIALRGESFRGDEVNMSNNSSLAEELGKKSSSTQIWKAPPRSNALD